MSRPISITDDQIVTAAREVFSRQGAAATTREIARAAGVSEGTLFNRFASKEALLQEAVRPPDQPAWVVSMEAMIGQGEMRANLASLARAMVDFVRERMPLLTLLWSLKVPYPLAEPGQESPPARDQQRLAAYFEAELRAGRLRSCDPRAVAQLLFGAVLGFTVGHRERVEPLDDAEVDAFVAGLVDTLWAAIGPESSPPS